MTAPPPEPGFRDRSVLVTGATGKVGRHLVAALLAGGARVAILSRDPARAGCLWPGAPIDYRAGDLTDPRTLDGALDAIDTVFHLASYAPRADEPDIYEAPTHWPVTAQGTRELMKQVAAGQVRRLVYLSSVKAMGDAAGAQGRAADETSVPRPDSLYGRAKLAAEQSVLALAGGPSVQVAVLRLPMVYGLPGQGNVARLIDAIARGRFPPWPRVENRRSAIHVEDAVRAALLVADHPRAAGQVYLITDGRPYSTRWLYEQIRAALGLPIPGWGLPLWTLEAAAQAGTLLERATGRAMPLTRVGLAKLTGDAWYSSEKIRAELGFVPEHSLETEIPAMVRDYLSARAPP
jgi:nucleoside-diphosphate-sugar epimerase